MVLGYAKDKATDPQSVEQVVDYKKLKVERLASVKAGTDKTLSKKYDPTKYRQIHHITYYKKSGEVLIDAITDGIAYQFECSGGELKIYEISNTFPK